jgi:prepilin-type N-terminal cleavage/methylation domain-containing protein
MNKKGFTLIEVLAVIVILGVLTMIGVYAISSNIEHSRKSAFVDIGINYVEKMMDMRAQDQLPIDITDYKGILIPLDKLKGNDKNNDISTPYGDIDLDSSYVVLVKHNKQYKFYLTIVTVQGDAIINVEYNELRTDWVMSIHSDYSEGEENKKYQDKLKEIINTKTVNGNAVIMAGTDQYSIDSKKEDYIILKKENG